jgi:hypothetical protein
MPRQELGEQLVAIRIRARVRARARIKRVIINSEFFKKNRARARTRARARIILSAFYVQLLFTESLGEDRKKPSRYTTMSF